MHELNPTSTYRPHEIESITQRSDASYISLHLGVVRVVNQATKYVHDYCILEYTDFNSTCHLSISSYILFGWALQR